MSVPELPPPPEKPPSPDASIPGMTAPGGRINIRRFARLWGFALFLVLLAYLFRGVLVPFIIAVAIAYILAPLVDRLSTIHVGKRHLPRSLAVVICYVVLIAGFVVFFMSFLPRVTNDLAKLGSEAPRMWDRMQHEWAPSVARFLERTFPAMSSADVPAQPALVSDLPPPPGTAFTVVPMANGDFAITMPPNGLEIERADDKRLIIRPREIAERKRFEELVRGRMEKLLVVLEGQVADVLKFGQVLIVGIISVMIQLIVVLLVAAYLLIDIDRIHAFVRSVIPDRYRVDYDAIVKGIDRGLNGVIRGQFIVCLFNGILIWVGLVIFGVKYAILLAALAAILSVIPIFGTIASTVPIVLVALISNDSGVDVTRALLIFAWVMGVHFIEANFFSPRILGKQARMHPVLVIFALYAGGSTFGVIGAVLAVPVASIIQTLFFYFRTRAWKTDTLTGVRASSVQNP